MFQTLSSSTRGIFLSALVVLGAATSACAVEEPRTLPAPTLDNAKSAGPLQTAVLAGGCFWGIQGVFEHVKGVKQAISGYSGGEASTAKYEMVGRGGTGHAEAVQVTFDPAQISYGQILQIFFAIAHDPTQLNMQYPDRGAQYRSNIFYADATQQKIATAYIAQLDAAKGFSQKIVTRVDALKKFYWAEDYHQDYLIHHPESQYIQTFDLPKIANLRKLMPAVYTPTAAMVAKKPN